MTTLERIKGRLQMMINSFDNDPPDSNFQQGYLCGLRMMETHIIYEEGIFDNDPIEPPSDTPID